MLKQLMENMDDLLRKSFYVEASLYGVALTCYLLLEQISTIQISIILPLSLLIIFNLVVARVDHKDIPRMFRSSMFLLPLLMLTFININKDNVGFMEHLFILPVLMYSLRFGTKVGIEAGIISWIGYAATTMMHFNASSLDVSPGTILLPGLIFLAVGWFVGSLGDNAKELNVICVDLESRANIDPATGVYKYTYFQEQIRNGITAAKKNCINLSVIILAIDDYQKYMDHVGKIVGEMTLQELGSIIKENIRGKDKVTRSGEEEFTVLLPGADSLDALDVAERIRVSVNRHYFQGKESKEGGLLTVSLGIATFPKDAEDRRNILYRANQALYRARHSRSNRVCLSSVNIEEVQSKIKKAGSALAESIPSLVAIIDAKDVNTCGHSERVTKYAMAIARELKLSDEELENIQFGALLHDIGKINVEEHILDKPGQLSDNEFYSIRNHPEFGANFISSIDYLKKVTPLVLYHHERYDGSGYPHGIAGEQIPLGARIIGVADAFDAMVSDRPYKQPMTHTEALGEIKRCSGTQFDPQIVQAFNVAYQKVQN